MARCGIEYYEMKLFGRWGSDAILRYLRDAPLEGSEDWVPDSLKKSSVAEVLMNTSVTLNSGKGALLFQGKDVDRIVAEAVNSRTSEVVRVMDGKVDEVKEIVDLLKEKKIEMDDRWAAELSRRFLPKLVVNLTSAKIHAVRDATHTACGFEWRNSRDRDLRRSVENYVMKCEKAACQNMFQRFQD